MSEPATLSDAVMMPPVLGMPRTHPCGHGDCRAECEELVSGAGDGDSLPREGVVLRRTRAGRCRLHGEMEYSQAWQKRAASAAKDGGAMGTLLDERERWEAKGHVFRGTPDRTHVDRRAGY